MSFFDEFNQMIPYTVKVSVGKNRQFKKDPKLISFENPTGKMVAVHRRPKTLEEMEKYGIGEYWDYIPAEQISMPIDLKVICDESLKPEIENTRKFTNKDTTNHTIVIRDASKDCVGYVDFYLKPSGDISEKTSFYHSADKNKEIMHSIDNNLIDGTLFRDEHFLFKKDSEEGKKEVAISQRDGKVVGRSVYEENKDSYVFVGSCVYDEPDYKKRGGSSIPWEGICLEGELLFYRKRMDEFQKFAKKFKEKTGIDITPQELIDLRNYRNEDRKKDNLSIFLKDINGSDLHPFIFHYMDIADYVVDEENDSLRDFKGQYIGNIIRSTDKKFEACVVTKHQKDGQDYRLYTVMDFTGISISKKGPDFYERLKSSDKTPTFVTRIGEDGKEDIVLYKGNQVFEECPEYDKFVQDFISPLSEIKPVQISKFIKHKKENER